MPVGSTLRQGTAWLFLGNSGNQVLGFALGIVLARLLGPEPFGMIATIQVFTGLIGLVAGGGMGQALVQSKEVSRRDYDIVFTIQLCIGLLIFACFFAIAPAFAAWYDNPLYADLLRVSALSFVLRPFVNLPATILHREMRFKSTAALGLLGVTLSNGISIGMAIMGFGVWSLTISGLVSSLAFAIVVARMTGWRPRLNFAWRHGNRLAGYGLLVAIGDVIVYIRQQLANLIISRTLGPQALGLFNKANSLSLIPHSLVTGATYQVSFRALSQAQDDLNTSRYIFLRALTLVALYTWPAFLILGWLALPLLRAVYGERWVGAAEVLQWVAVVGPFIMVEILAGCVLGARNWLKREIPVQLAQLAVLAVGIFAGLEYGLVGIAIGASLSNIYGAIHMSWLAARALDMPVTRVLQALKAPALLCASVLAMWVGLDAFAIAGTDGSIASDLLRLCVFCGAGASLYVGLFLLVPPADLRTESDKWRSKIAGLGHKLLGREP